MNPQYVAAMAVARASFAGLSDAGECFSARALAKSVDVVTARAARACLSINKWFGCSSNRSALDRAMYFHRPSTSARDAAP